MQSRGKFSITRIVSGYSRIMTVDYTEKNSLDVSNKNNRLDQEKPARVALMKMISNNTSRNFSLQRKSFETLLLYRAQTKKSVRHLILFAPLFHFHRGGIYVIRLYGRLVGR